MKVKQNLLHKSVWTMFPLVLFDYHTIEVALSCECLFSMKGCFGGSIYLEWFHFHSSLLLVYCLYLVHYGSVCPCFNSPLN